MIRRLHRRPAARELAGYVLVGGAFVALIANLQTGRNRLRWAVHKAADLVPPPDPEEV